MKLSLVVLNAGKASGQSIAITTPQFIIGRDPKCNLRPASAAISNRHCALFIRNDKVYIRDFESTNGTFVNDEPVKADRQIKHDDQLKVGPLTFKVVIERSVPVDKPTPLPKAKAKVPEKTAENQDDDAAGALLLSLDDSVPGESTVDPTTDEESVPGGSTIMEIPAILRKAAEVSAAAAEREPAPEKKAEPPKKAPSNDNAQSAAQALLERMRKGGRKSE